MKLPATPSFRLDNKKALVVGASSGIGLGCAVALAEAGADVTLAARRAEPLDAAVAALNEAGFKASSMVLDITDLEAVKNQLDVCEPFEIMVNSAGLARHSPALDTEPADYDAVMDINVRAAYFLSVVAARGMERAGGGGSIINISSQMAHVGGIDRAVYAASKHAIEGMTKSMAIEWGEHEIRVNTICPTFIKTPLTEQTFANPERVAWIKSKLKLPRIGEVEDIMGAVVFLASDASALITGSSLLIDGGWTAD